jgi:ABC-type sugar transport system ATPase subunit
MIQLENIFKWHNNGNNRVFLLKDISLSVAEGDFISVMGPSGSGKSTLLNVIGMLDEASEGSYRFLGQDVFKIKEKHRAELYKENIGFVFQAYHLIDELTVYENIETPLLYQSIRTAETPGDCCRYTRQVQYCWEKRPVPRTIIRRTATIGRYCTRPWLPNQNCYWQMSQQATLIQNRVKISWSCLKRSTKKTV